MIKPEQVPEAVWRVAMMTYHREIRRHPEQAWQLAISAALTTWPGMAAFPPPDDFNYPRIILPLTAQEKTDGS